MKEFLFNILMQKDIAFLTNKQKTLFVLLDYKVCISSEKNIDEKFMNSLINNKFDYLFFENGKIPMKKLKKIIKNDEIEEYDEIII